MPTSPSKIYPLVNDAHLANISSFLSHLSFSSCSNPLTRLLLSYSCSPLLSLSLRPALSPLRTRIPQSVVVVSVGRVDSMTEERVVARLPKWGREVSIGVMDSDYVLVADVSYGHQICIKASDLMAHYVSSGRDRGEMDVEALSSSLSSSSLKSQSLQDLQRDNAQTPSKIPSKINQKHSRSATVSSSSPFKPTSSVSPVIFTREQSKSLAQQGSSAEKGVLKNKKKNSPASRLRPWPRGSVTGYVVNSSSPLAMETTRMRITWRCADATGNQLTNNRTQSLARGGQTSRDWRGSANRNKLQSNPPATFAVPFSLADLPQQELRFLNGTSVLVLLFLVWMQVRKNVCKKLKNRLFSSTYACCFSSFFSLVSPLSFSACRCTLQVTPGGYLSLLQTTLGVLLAMQHFFLFPFSNNSVSSPATNNDTPAKYKRQEATSSPKKNKREAQNSSLLDNAMAKQWWVVVLCVCLYILC